METKHCETGMLGGNGVAAFACRRHAGIGFKSRDLNQRSVLVAGL